MGEKEEVKKGSVDFGWLKLLCMVTSMINNICFLDRKTAKKINRQIKK